MSVPMIVAPPWDYDADDLGVWINSAAYPQPIAKMGSCTLFDAKAHAALIVRAVNSHAAMLGALRGLAIIAEQHIADLCADAQEGNPITKMELSRWRAVLSAIVKAESE